MKTNIKAEKREIKQKPKMPVSGKKVFVLRNIILKKGVIKTRRGASV